MTNTRLRIVSPRQVLGDTNLNKNCYVEEQNVSYVFSVSLTDSPLTKHNSCSVLLSQTLLKKTLYYYGRLPGFLTMHNIVSETNVPRICEMSNGVGVKLTQFNKDPVSTWSNSKFWRTKYFEIFSCKL